CQQPRRYARTSVDDLAVWDRCISGTGSEIPLVADRIRHAFGWALAVPALWVSTVVYPAMGLGYLLVLGVVDTIGHVARRWRARPASTSIPRHPAARPAD